MFKKMVLAVVATSVASTALANWQNGSYDSHVSLPPLYPGDVGLEASGAVWDPIHQRIVVVDDQGTVSSTNGGSRFDVDVEPGHHPDLEAIATPGNGLLYVGEEGGGGIPNFCEHHAPRIMELNSSSLVKTGRSWSLHGLPTKCGTGMEGLTWVPSGNHPYGSKGVFYASSQQDGKIYVFDVNLSISGSTPTLLNPGGWAPLPQETDISDLYYDPAQKMLFVLYDDAEALIAVDIKTPTPRLVADYRLPSTPRDQEGVTFKPSCTLGGTATASGTTMAYLADDPSGSGYYSFSGFPGVCASDSRQAVTVTQTIPLSLEAHEIFLVSITIRNTGTTAWTGSTFGLFPTQSTLLPSLSLGASESIARGQTKTFNLSVRGPAKKQSQSIPFQWRMKQGNTWFGIPTPEVLVFVHGTAETCPHCR